MNKITLALLGISLLTGCSRPEGTEVTHISYYSPYGPQIDKRAFEEQEQTGEVVERLRNGCDVRTVYVHGKLHGTSSVTFPNSSVVHTYEEYVKGKIVSRGVNFETGIPEFEEEFTARGTRLVTCWYSDGSPKIMEEWVDSKLLSGTYLTVDGEEESKVQKGNGTRIERDKSGLLISKDSVQEGLILTRAHLFASGMISESIELQEGIRNGTSKVFLESGEPLRIETWSQGKLNGLQTFFENGLKTTEVTYSMGLKQGVERRFTPGTDTVIAETTWFRDRLHGPSITYKESGAVTQWYWNGEKVTEETFALRAVQTGRPNNLYNF